MQGRQGRTGKWPTGALQGTYHCGSPVYSSSGLRDGRIRSGSSSLAVVVFRKLRESRIFTLMDDRVGDHMEGDHGWEAVGSETMDRRGIMGE